MHTRGMTLKCVLNKQKEGSHGLECSLQPSVYTTNEVRQVQQEQWTTKQTPSNGVKGTASNLTSTTRVIRINI
jgi:hypothetical protein